MILFSLRLCAEALTRGPGGLTHINIICMLSLIDFEPQQTVHLHSDALQSNMQHVKRGRFVSGGAYEGKQITSGEQPDMLVFPRKAPSA